MQHLPSEPIALYQSQLSPCPYLPDRPSASLFIDPRIPIGTQGYSQLIDQGFRRAGHTIYRPQCPACQACIPVRIPVERFQPRRSQKRILARNTGLHVSIEPMANAIAYWPLYQRYMQQRHPGTPSGDVHDYQRFILESPVESRLLCFREQNRLLAVAVTDVLPQGLSAVYTFYEPDASARGLGSNAILWQIQWARDLHLPYLYLGYWIAGSEKMAYKTAYRPLEFLSPSGWATLP